MQKLFSLFMFSAVVVVFGLSTGAAHANSYQVFNLGNTNVSLDGIDAAGTVLLQQFNTCNGLGGPNFCYEEFSAGNLIYRGDSAPKNFVAENGTACASPIGLQRVGRSVCDGGYQVTGAFSNDGFGVWESYPGSGTVGDLVLHGSADVLYVNAAGDFLVADGMHEYVYQVMVAQTPEPSSLLLLATGALGLGAVLRRRVLTR